MAGNFESIKNLFEEKQIFFGRCAVAAGFCLLAVAILVTRMTGLQIVQHDYYSTRSDENRMRLWVIPPVRGFIHDRRGVLLADNTPAFVLKVNAEKTGDLDDTLRRLGHLVRITDNDLVRFNERRRKSPRYTDVPLRFNLSPEELANYQVNRFAFQGVDIEPSLARRYPLGATAAHVTGYIGGITEADLERVDEKAYRGTNYIGKTGVERSHETLLHGQLGTRIVETNAAGRPLRELEYRSGEPGRNLFLTLDAQLQLAAERALGAHSGVIVALAPESGEVLALVSKPGFDPHLFVDGIDVPTYKALNADPKTPLFNRALQGQYSPGSTIKPLMVLAGLEYRDTNPSESVYCNGEFVLPGSDRKYRCHKRKGHGWVDMDRSVASSCDIYFYELSLSLGIDRIHGFLSKFGLGRSTGLDLPSENSGLLPSRDWKRRTRREGWFSGETLITGIGQGYFLSTPMQLAHLTARVALRGRGFRPHIVHAVQDPTGVLHHVPPEPLPRIAIREPAHWDRIIKTMEDVVHTPSGTAWRIGRTAPYRIAGKTGTVQVAAMKQDEEEAPDLESIPENLRDHALFIAFAPIEKPRIALAVLVEHGGHGGSVAAPVAREVMDAYLLDDSGALIEHDTTANPAP